MAPKSIEPTDWVSHALDEMRRVCASMQAASAAADAEAIKLIARRIQVAAEVYEASLPRMYPEGEFSGETVNSSRQANIAGIRHTDGSAAVGIKIADHISTIAGILSQTQSHIADIDESFSEYEGNSAAIAMQRSLMAKTMTEAYSNPVIGANGSLPEYDASPLPVLGAGFEPAQVMTAGAGGAGGGSGDNSPALFAPTGINGAKDPDGPGGPSGPGGDQTSYAGGPAGDTPFTLGSGTDTAGSGADGSTPGPLNGAFGAPISGGAGGGGSTSAAAMNSTGRAGSGSGSGSGSSAGGGSGGGRAGGGGGAGGVGTEANPLGRRTPASLISPTTGANQSAGATPSTGARGASPMGSPAGGRGAGKDKDGQHRAPSYLHTRENGDEIVGRLPLVGPPVLGDWARVVDLSTPVEGSQPDTPGGDGADNPDSRT
ncbi:hypothetical protein [Williamsia sp.]|uniref:hypothetical protein n=1 Tax=Williamsia sp. TaxID=1872085 RepID=UPI002F93E26A